MIDCATRTDGVESMSYTKQRGCREFRLDRALELRVCLDVDTTRRLVLQASERSDYTTPPDVEAGYTPKR